MPSFDIVSELDHHELTNAVDQAKRVIETRFDFKGSDAQYHHTDGQIQLLAKADIHIRQMTELLEQAFTKRGLDVRALDWGDIETTINQTKRTARIQEGLEKDLAKKIIKHIKDEKLKVQAQIQGEQVRVTGKKRDDLQTVMASIKGAGFDIPLQFTNFRD